MQTVNCMVALGGHMGNTVPKYRVTASELAVLRAIHGDDSVFDIEPSGEVNVSPRAERQRLHDIYGRARDSQQTPVVDKLFPGAAAPMFNTIAELDIPQSLYKPVRAGGVPPKTLKTPAAPASAASPVTPPVASSATLAEPADGISDIADAHSAPVGPAAPAPVSTAPAAVAGTPAQATVAPTPAAPVAEAPAPPVAPAAPVPPALPAAPAPAPAAATPNVLA